MIGRVVMILIFSALGALAAGWWVNHSAIIAKQEDDLQMFMNAGPRFTGYDGQELCQRVRMLEELSIGFRKAGHKPLECNYWKKAKK